MKNQAIHYLGLDVHQGTVVANVRNEQGTVVLSAVVPTEASAILGLVRAAGQRVHVAFEEGTHAQWLHDLLQPHAERVIVCNVRGKNEVENKSDRIDAADLSEKLRLGALKAVYHGPPSVLTLKELVRNYNSLVEDATRVMLRIKALFRARAIRTPGTSVYRARRRQEWLDQLTTPGARVRAACLLEQLDLLLKLRPKAKAAMIAEAKKQPGWKSLRSMPFIGDVRTAQLMAILITPYRFRTKRNLWPYAGLAVVTRSSADQEFVGGKLRRRAKPPRTRGLNRNHNPMLKSILKGAATAASAKPGALKDIYEACIARGTKPEMALLTLTRKIASIALHLWKKGELWDPAKLTMQTT
jgi:filamentous hemagglutinin family protein